MSGGGRGEGNYKFRVVFFSDGLTLQRWRQKTLFGRNIWFSNTHTIHVWYIYLHLVYFYGFHVGKFMDGMGYLLVFHSKKPLVEMIPNEDPREG